MKKMTLKMWLLGGFVAIASLCATSCAEGADCDERWESEVSNAQLESPAIDASCIEIIANADGSETAKFTWPMVAGAGGFEVKVVNINDPANPVYLVDTLIDGQTVTFPNKEETDYTIAVRTLGNEARNNTAATTASEMAYTTWLPNTTVPAGSELSTFIAENLATSENIIRLLPGEEYTLTGVADFNLSSKILSGNADDRPIVKVSGEGCLMTQAGLTVKNIAFDCEERTSKGVITFHDNPDQSLWVENLPMFDSNINRKNYIIQETILITGCWFKNVSNSLIFANSKAWGICDFQMLNNIVQFKYDGGNPMLLHLQGGNYATIRDMKISNNTFYNTLDTKAYWIRFASAVNPEKAFGGDAKNVAMYEWTNNTVYQINNNCGSNFANNTPNTGTQNVKWENNIFYNLSNPSKLINSCKYTGANNTVYRIDPSKSITDAQYYNDATKYDSDTKSHTEKDENDKDVTIWDAAPQDPAFVGPIQELDFSQPNGGVNFAPTGANALNGKRGDPRWL